MRSSERQTVEAIDSRTCKSATDVSEPDGSAVSRNLDIRLKPPLLWVWLTAAIAIVLCCLGVSYFHKTPRGAAAISIFVWIEAFFLVPGVFWLIRGWARGWRRVVLGGIAIIVPSIFVGSQVLSKVAWVGGCKTVLPVRVVADNDGTAVAGATVRVGRALWESHGGATVGETDQAGEVRITHTFQCCGTTTLLDDHSVIEITLYDLEVEAAGYEPLLISLSDRFITDPDIHGPPLPPIEVRLVPRR